MADACRAATFNDVAPATLYRNTYGRALQFDCPALTESASAVFLSGDGCSNEKGYTFDGTIEYTWGGDATDAFADLAFEGFWMLAEQGGPRSRLALHGTSTRESREGGALTTHAVDDEEESMYDGEPNTVSGSWTRSVDDGAGAREVRSEIVLRSSLEGVVGELALDGTLGWADVGCDEELEGTSTLAGASVATLAWNTRRCDGCAELTLDGRDEGTVFGERGANPVRFDGPASILCADTGGPGAGPRRHSVSPGSGPVTRVV